MSKRMGRVYNLETDRQTGREKVDEGRTDRHEWMP